MFSDVGSVGLAMELAAAVQHGGEAAGLHAGREGEDEVARECVKRESVRVLRTGGGGGSDHGEWSEARGSSGQAG